MTNESPAIPTLPIQFATPLDDLSGIASEINRGGTWLRTLTERAIRTRHTEAFIEHESDRIHRPPIHCLPLCRRKSLRVYFTVERHAILVRGYAWDIVGEPRDDFDGGFVITR